MASKSDIIVGLDIGTTKIAVIVAQRSETQELDIIGIGTQPSRGLRKGVVINIEATVESIRKAVEEAELMAGVEISDVFAGISGSHIKGVNSNGVVAVKSREVSDRDLERVIDAAKAVAIPMDREVLHVLPQEFIVDDQDGIKEPVGMSGVRLESRVHIITGAVASAENIIKSSNRCGLNVRDIVLEPLASAAATLSQEEKELGVVMVDIGGGTTDVTIFHGGALKYTSVLPLGGTNLTKDIAAGLRTSMATAEIIKHQYGTTLSTSVTSEETFPVPMTGGREPQVKSRRFLAEIIQPRMEEILNLVGREITLSGFADQLAGGVVLTGGTVLLDGTNSLADEVLGLPVRIGHPGQDVGGLIDVVSSPSYSTGVGLALYAKELEETGGLRLGPDQSIFLRVKHRMADWFAEHF